MAEDKYLGQELSVNRKEFKSCLWDGLKKLSMKNLYTFKSTEVFGNRNRYVYGTFQLMLDFSRIPFIWSIGELNTKMCKSLFILYMLIENQMKYKLV